MRARACQKLTMMRTGSPITSKKTWMRLMGGSRFRLPKNMLGEAATPKVLLDTDGKRDVVIRIVD